MKVIGSKLRRPTCVSADVIRDVIVVGQQSQMHSEITVNGFAEFLTLV